MRLIDADAMIKRLKEWDTDDAMDKALYNFTMHRILEQPIIRTERKPGKWEPIVDFDGYVDFRCSACHKYRFHNGEMREKYKYCPNCGVKMEETE